MSYGLTKTVNEYAHLLDEIEASKAVLAALAVSFAIRCGYTFDDVATAIFDEWATLHVQGIVPQKPRRLKKREAKL